jgi:fatty acid-binding protein DegV
MRSAVEAVINHLKTRNLDSRHILYISHADALEDAKKIYNQIKETFADLEIKIMDLSPVFVAQGGPQCVAIQYIER